MKGIKQIKNYRLTKEIGKGATAVVYEAVDDSTNKLTAIKAIASAKLKDPRAMENFKRELKLLHGLNHPNIIKIKGVEKTVNNIYLILEYCNGGNLLEFMHSYKRVNRGLLPEQIVQRILQQLIEGLEYMHNSRTVHRDIKLENILLNFNSVRNEVVPGGMPEKIDYKKLGFEGFSIKIADLGYARELEGGGVASTICGTPITMAPDIINLFNDTKVKDQKYNNKVDLWSLGAITYELLVGTPPFYASNFNQLFKEVMHGKYELPKNLKISVEAITFINGLLQFYPEKRMTWSEINAHPFIRNDPKTFNYIDLHTVESNYDDPKTLQFDTKDCENFVWLNFKTKKDIMTVDKIDQSIYQNPLLEKLKTENEDITQKEDENKDAGNNIVDKCNNLNKNTHSSGEVYEDAVDEINLAVEIQIDDKKDDKKSDDTNTNTQEVVEQTKPQSENRLFHKILSEMKQSLGTIKEEKDRESKCSEDSTKKNSIDVVVAKPEPEVKTKKSKQSKKTDKVKKNTKQKKQDTQNIENLKENLETIPSETTPPSQKEDNAIIPPRKSCQSAEEENQALSNNKESCLNHNLPANDISVKINIEETKEEVAYEDNNVNNKLESNLNIHEENIKNNQSEDYINVPEPCKHDSDTEETEQDDLWDIISTRSITEDEFHCDLKEDDYMFIPEYFK